MRRSRSTDTLVLISNHVESIYHDRWLGETLHYTGMGREGNQRLDATQNRTLAESPTTTVQVHLFEVHRQKAYTYRGQVRLAGDPYSEAQPDQKGDERQVWVFPLQLIDAPEPRITEGEFRESAERKQKQARRLTDGDLKRRAVSSPRQAGQRSVVSKQYERSPWVSEFAKRRANGICQLCEQPAPFDRKDGEPFLEVHHIVWLARGGEDVIENTVALCPNCHRRMHVLDKEADRETLTGLVSNST
jgi:5-methylcytosine-specific restriction protein A